MKARTMAMAAGLACGFPALAQIELTHSTNPTTIVAGASVACATGGGTTGFLQVTTGNSFWRSYDLNTFPAVPLAGMNVSQVEFGVERCAHPAGDLPITVNIYRDTNGGTPTAVGVDLVLVGTGSIGVPDQTTAQFFTANVAGTFAKTDTLVVEVSAPDLRGFAPPPTGTSAVPGGENAVFFMGANGLGQTGPSYISSAACNLPNPTDFALINFPGTHILIKVIGQDPGGVVGRCCFAATGNCQVLSQASCIGAGGIYDGNGTACGSPNPCPQPATGACCAVTGCSVGTQAVCVASGGTYQGNGSTCTGQCPVPPVLTTNCNLATGTTTLGGAPIPVFPGEWSEAASAEGDPTTANTTAGFGVTGALRLADDFVVPAGGQQIGYIRVYAYTTGTSFPSVSAATLRILDGSPAAGGNVVFGDQTTNRLAGNKMSDIYRIFNTLTGATCGSAGALPGLTRQLQEVYIEVNQFFNPGTYWIDYNLTGASFAPPATQSDAIGRQCDPNNSNALQFNAGWVAVNDAGIGCTPVPLQQDLYFQVLGPLPGGGGCYANCDGSSGNPLLTANDFSCFLNKFVGGDSYADCDGVGGLTANDFTCFLGKYTAGCS